MGFMPLHPNTRFTTTTILRQLYRTTSISRHPSLRTGVILLDQSFTAHKPLLMATSAFRLGRKHYNSPQESPKMHM